MEMLRSKWRPRPVLRLRHYLLEKQSPRFDMAGLLALTGSIGFLASAWLLQQGLTSMWLRYPAAASIAYTFFLLTVVLVVGAYHGRARESCSDLTELVPDPPKLRGPDSSSGGSVDGIDLGTGLDGDEGCLIVLVFALVAGLLLVAGYVVFTAPTLLAELLLDSLLIGGLYRRIRKAEPDSLFFTAFRRTLGPALLVIVLLALLGAGLEAYAPEAVSIGAVFARSTAP